MSKYYVDDIGVDIVIDVGADLSSATYVAMHVKKPDDTEEIWSASVYTTTKIKHTVIAGEWDQTGRYYIQAYVELPDWSGLGDKTYFDILADFQ